MTAEADERMAITLGTYKVAVSNRLMRNVACSVGKYAIPCRLSSSVLFVPSWLFHNGLTLSSGWPISTQVTV